MTKEIKSGTLYGYARVSTVQQDLGMQTEALVKEGVPYENIFAEKMSGKNAKDRVEWNTLKDKLVKGDVVVVHKLDRLGRSMVDVMKIVEEFKEKGIFIKVIDAGIDTRNDAEDGSMGGLMTKALMSILALVAEMERSFIIERTKPAIAQAKKNGVKFGRPQANKKIYIKAVKEFINADGKLSVPKLIEEYGKDTETGKDFITQATFFRRVKEYRDFDKVLEKVKNGMKLDQALLDVGGLDDKNNPVLSEKNYHIFLDQYNKK